MKKKEKKLFTLFTLSKSQTMLTCCKFQLLYNFFTGSLTIAAPCWSVYSLNFTEAVYS